MHVCINRMNTMESIPRTKTLLILFLLVEFGVGPDLDQNNNSQTLPSSNTQSKVASKRQQEARKGISTNEKSKIVRLLVHALRSASNPEEQVENILNAQIEKGYIKKLNRQDRDNIVKDALEAVAHMHQRPPKIAASKTKEIDVSRTKIERKESTYKSINSQDTYDFPELLTSLNRDVDPCEDFYHHVCDGFKKTHDPSLPPSNVGRINQYDLADNEIERRIFSILETSRKHFNKKHDTYVEQMFLFYDSCMDQEKRLKDKSAFLLNKLTSMKKLPTDHVSYNADWLISAYPYKAFYNYEISRDLNNSSQNIVYFGPIYDANSFAKNSSDNSQKDMMPVHYLKLEHEERRKNYNKYLSQILRLLVDEDVEHKVFRKENIEAEIKRRVDNYMEVETERMKIMWNLKGTNYDNPYAIYTFATLGELVKKKNFSPSKMDWTKYFKKFMPAHRRAQGKSDDIHDMGVAVEEFESFPLLAHMINNLDTQKLSDYLEWRIILKYLPFLDQRFFKERLNFIDKPVDQRWFCKTLVVQYFPHQLDKLYVEKHYNKEKDGPVIEAMRHYMGESFREIINDSDWMDKNTKLKALEKLDLMEIHIGYVPSVYDHEFLHNRYGHVHLKKDMGFPEMIWILDKRDADYKMSTMSEKGHSYYYHSLEANTFYHWWYNALFIQAGFLQSPLYHSEFPDALKYGGLGHMYAHEIIHGYDTRGHQQNGHGELKNWWDQATKTKYQEKKQCLIDQYSKVKVEIDENTTLSIDGTLTQGENVADHGGMRIAYKAFQKYLNDAKKRNELSVEKNLRKVRGLEDYSEEQLFFVGSAFIRCEQHTPEQKMNLMKWDEHAMTPARVNVLMSNTPEFSEAFECAKNTKMNPSIKYNVW